jgi:protoheme IX farnesyltransferase
MKATTNAFAPAIPTERSWVSVYAELFKARLTSLVLLTTSAGFYLGSRGQTAYELLLPTVAGVGLLAAGGAALNELFERDFDALMHRTRSRPIPSGRLRPDTVAIVGWTCALLGLVCLGLAVNWLTCLLGAITLTIYLFVYTPLKRVSWLNTAVGAIPGALPPLMGWTAARGELDPAGWSLFLIQAFWQIPHFMAIAWIYRDEYAKAGFRMLPVFDPTGSRTARQAVSHTFALVAASLFPFLFHIAGPLYLATALVLGALFLGCAFLFLRDLTIRRARQLFLVSILYLPLLMTVLVIDKPR